MEDDLNILANIRLPQHFGKWETTSTFGKKKTTSIFWQIEKMEGNLNILEYG
jgi:hypothetical protein